MIGHTQMKNYYNKVCFWFFVNWCPLLKLYCTKAPILYEEVAFLIVCVEKSVVILSEPQRTDPKESRKYCENWHEDFWCNRHQPVTFHSKNLFKKVSFFMTSLPKSPMQPTPKSNHKRNFIHSIVNYSIPKHKQFLLFL